MYVSKGGPQATPRSQAPPDSARSQGQGLTARSAVGQGEGQRSQFTKGQVVKTVQQPTQSAPVIQPQVQMAAKQQGGQFIQPAMTARSEVVSPSVIEVYDQR